jgi:uncharacterized protein with LGFP repeats
VPPDAPSASDSPAPHDSPPAAPPAADRPLDVVELSPDAPSKPGAGGTRAKPAPAAPPIQPTADPAPAEPAEPAPAATPAAAPATKADAIRRASEALTSARSQIASLKQQRSAVPDDKVDHFNQAMMSLDWQVTKMTAGVEALKGADADTWQAVAQELENVIAEFRNTVAEVKEKYGVR